MKLKIVNLHDGLIDPQSKKIVPLDRQIYVNDIAFWRRRVEQGHVELLAKMSDEEAEAEKRAECETQFAFEKKAAPKKAAPKKSSKKSSKKPAPETTEDAVTSDEKEG